jgi:prolyl-tRNA synthetase
MRTRLFLRTSEFLWQEGHTAHATREEAVEETERMINIYADFAENFMALPVIKGYKSENERFAGALDTYAIEALMQDGKALQAGTSHFLGQNFAKAFDVQFTDRNGKLDYVWATSWGLSTRMIGALIMAHSDNHGLVLPPRLAPIQVVIVPIFRKQEQLAGISVIAGKIKSDLEPKGISVKFDDRENNTPGWKFADYELKGVPVRLAIGPRDMENGTVEIARRDTLEKETIPADKVSDHVIRLLTEIQTNIFIRASEFKKENTFYIDKWDDFLNKLDNGGGFIMAHWDGTAETEEKIKDESKATIRCIPFDSPEENGKCIYSGKPSKRRVLFARSY